MKLLLARHGNTFSPEMTPVFVGSREDMPLVAEGYRQAERFAELIKLQQSKISAVFCGPLKRTRQFAETVISTLQLDLKVEIDDRLDELDYGDWSGKTNGEVEAMFGESALAAWNDDAVWPSDCNWQPSSEEVVRQVTSFVDDLQLRHLAHETILSVTSNGRLRYFLKLVPGAFEEKAQQKKLKVAPGNACQLDFADGKASLVAWNQSPQMVLSRPDRVHS